MNVDTFIHPSYLLGLLPAPAISAEPTLLCHGLCQVLGTSLFATAVGTLCRHHLGCLQKPSQLFSTGTDQWKELTLKGRARESIITPSTSGTPWQFREGQCTHSSPKALIRSPGTQSTQPSKSYTADNRRTWGRGWGGGRERVGCLRVALTYIQCHVAKSH